MSDNSEILTAIQQHDSAAFQKLLAALSDTAFHRACQKHQILYHAARHRNAEAVQRLRERGADVDIFACCYLPDVSRGFQLLKQQPRLTNQFNSNGQSPLHVACQTGCLAMAERLIALGADVNAQDNNGRTPISAAAHGGPWKPAADPQIINLLLKSGAVTDFWVAAEIGRLDLLKIFLSERPQLLNQLDETGSTALYYAAANNHAPCVQYLLQQRADPNAGSDTDRTPLSTAALHLLSQQCDPAVCRALIEAGAIYDLHTAAALNDIDRIRQLVVQNDQAVLNRRHGLLPTDYAAHCGHPEALRILLEAGAPADSCDDHGYTLRSKCAHLPTLAAILQDFERPGP